jgi:hypothetical protein
MTMSNMQTELADLRSRIVALEAEEARSSIRYRVNVSTTSKGLPSWEATVDAGESGASRDEVLAAVAEMVTRLRRTYPTEATL